MQDGGGGQDDGTTGKSAPDWRGRVEDLQGGGAEVRSGRDTETAMTAEKMREKLSQADAKRIVKELKKR
jgi:hypothetical protein